MASPQYPCKQHVEREAGHWVVRKSGGELSDEEARQFRAWHDANPDHAAAFRKLENLWRHLGHVDRKRLAPGRRKTLPVVILACTTLALASQAPGLWQDWQADYVSATGHIEVVQLADGSTVTLDSDSAIQWVATKERREIRLLRGRAHFDVAHQANDTPFVVVTPQAEATALGTRFDVETDNKATQVMVYESRVAVRCLPCQPQAENILPPGQAIDIDEATVATALPMPRTQTAGAGGWRDGMLAFDNASVAQVLSRLARYSTKPIVLLDAQTGARRVSAVVSSRDPDAALSALAELGIIRVTFIPGITLVR